MIYTSRNFVCPIIGENCPDPRCLKERCILSVFDKNADISYEDEIKERNFRRSLVRREAAHRVLVDRVKELNNEGKNFRIPHPKRMRKGPKRDHEEANLNALIDGIISLPRFADRL